MKQIVFLLVCITASLEFSIAQEESITFNEKKHDFGVIPEKGESVSFDFILTNNTKTPLLIKQVTASCKCTTPVWTESPIGSGESGVIKVTYNPDGLETGLFSKYVTVHTNQGSPFILQITGEAAKLPIPKKTKEIYPATLGNYFFKSKKLNFGQLGISDSKTMRLEIFNNSDKPISQKIIPSKYFIVNYNPVVESKQESVIEITFLAKNYNKYGYLNGNLVFYINGKRQNFPYSALILDDFSKWNQIKKNNAGKISTNAAELNFGNFTAGTSRTLKILNLGNSVLHVRNIQSSNPVVTPSKTTLAVNPGEFVEMKVYIDKYYIKSAFNSKLTIISDDPEKPVSEVIINANP